jgi:hypothetical protein
MSFVSSNDVPACIAEKVAVESHRRGCATFDGRRFVGGPAFDGSHRSLDSTWAAIHVADVCNALGLTPAQLWAISNVAAGDDGAHMG